MAITMSQKAAREGLGSPELFKGGVFITKNGIAELFVQTVVERDAEIKERELEQQSMALLKMVMLSKQDLKQQGGFSTEETRQRLRAARK